ncbi:MAG: YfcE family phosphodiesterase [Euryarchaeota archaeon]|nr:YfcE family phosphodiesterase [Euryarchaeota archaeon]
MTRIIVISDTHDHKLPDTLIPLLEDADMIVHAGDFMSVACYEYLDSINEMVAVCGNSDCAELRKYLPERMIFDVEDITIGVVHDGQLSLNGTCGLWYLAKELEVDVLIVGHLHTPFIEESDVLIMCPGSPTVPRLADRSAIELVIEGNRVHGQVISLGMGTCLLGEQR